MLLTRRNEFSTSITGRAEPCANSHQPDDGVATISYVHRSIRDFSFNFSPLSTFFPSLSTSDKPKGWWRKLEAKSAVNAHHFQLWFSLYRSMLLLDSSLLIDEPWTIFNFVTIKFLLSFSWSKLLARCPPTSWFMFSILTMIREHNVHESTECGVLIYCGCCFDVCLLFGVVKDFFLFLLIILSLSIAFLFYYLSCELLNVPWDLNKILWFNQKKKTNFTFSLSLSLSFSISINYLTKIFLQFSSNFLSFPNNYRLSTLLFMIWNTKELVACDLKTWSNGRELWWWWCGDKENESGVFVIPVEL